MRRLSTFFFWRHAADRQPIKLLSVDIDAEMVSERARRDPDIELLTMSSLDPKVAQRISCLATPVLPARLRHFGQ